ncbi:InlB B-repeat-containing protein [Eggerthellaceae bacterium zg-997]|nr:InlB B-repeat-containing protein [Eggerthellaceae bacterium zg-997]
MRRFGCLVMASFALGAAMLCAPQSAMAASSETFYNGIATNTQPVTADDGVSRAIYFADDAGATSNFGYTSDVDVRRMNRSIIDVDNYSTNGLYAVARFTNGSGAPVALSETVLLPTVWHGAHTDGADLRAAGPVAVGSADASTAARIRLTAAAGQRVELAEPGQAVADYDAAGYRWGDLREVYVHGMLAAGDTLTVKVPLRLENPDVPGVTSGATYSQFTVTKGGKVMARFAHQRLNPVDGSALLASEGKYLGGFRNSETEYVYTQVPAKIQELLPAITKSDLFISNILYQDRHSATQDERLYTGGSYCIDLTRIRAAVRDHGFSVATGSSAREPYLGLPGWTTTVDHNVGDDLLQEYWYNTKPGAFIASNAHDGSSARTNGDGIGTLYTELRQVIRAHDLAIAAGTAWTIADNLDWMVDHTKQLSAPNADPDPQLGRVAVASDREQARVVVTDGDGRVVLDTAAAAGDRIAASEQRIAATPGVYQVRYFYYFNRNAAAGGDDYEVSAAVTLTVSADYLLSYDANGGTDAPAAQAVAGSTDPTASVGVSEAVPTREGYRFMGWNTMADGSGDSYAAGQDIRLVAAAPAVVLYAQWEASADGGSKGEGPEGGAGDPEGPKASGKERVIVAPAKSVPQTGDATTAVSVLGAVAGLMSGVCVLALRRRDKAPAGK